MGVESRVGSITLSLSPELEAGLSLNVGGLWQASERPCCHLEVSPLPRR